MNKSTNQQAYIQKVAATLVRGHCIASQAQKTRWLSDKSRQPQQTYCKLKITPCTHSARSRASGQARRQKRQDTHQHVKNNWTFFNQCLCQMRWPLTNVVSSPRRRHGCRQRSDSSDRGSGFIVIGELALGCRRAAPAVLLPGLALVPHLLHNAPSDCPAHHHLAALRACHGDVEAGVATAIAVQHVWAAAADDTDEADDIDGAVVLVLLM
ncbi:hypothetical protein BX661DRAFT_86875 [Kickxella alabastrina]|uniref:uncharacterized protein n=1 Tax=Kickxella alabastrina TaxID=61397 RepID=UPI00221F3A3A|nr:uncharacterized protein BX661DRAFT_86875 [Kickxella alabastrina]KAI7832021.1 hypothetical protein BX661DRAFT_86875 [Kickxella alabastrina]